MKSLNGSRPCVPLCESCASKELVYEGHGKIVVEEYECSYGLPQFPRAYKCVEYSKPADLPIKSH